MANDWRSRCDWCGWQLVPQGEAGCWDGNCSMRPRPPLNAAQQEVLDLKQAVRRAERDAADWKARFEGMRETESHSAFSSRDDVLEEAACIALEQRCERGTPWDRACVEIASKIRGAKTPHRACTSEDSK